MSDIKELALSQAREYLTQSDTPLAGLPLADRHSWFRDASERHIKAMINIHYRGGWEAFYERTFQEMVA